MIFELSQHSHWPQFCWKESWHNMSPLYLCVQCLYILSLISPQAFWIKIQDYLCHQFYSQPTCIPLLHSVQLPKVPQPCTVQLHNIPTIAQCTASQSTHHCTKYMLQCTSSQSTLPLHNVHIHKVPYHCAVYIFIMYPTAAQGTYSESTPSLHNAHIYKVPHHCIMYIFTKYPTTAQCIYNSQSNPPLYSVPLHKVPHHCTMHMYIHKVPHHCTVNIFTKYPTTAQCTYSQTTPPLHRVHVYKIPHHWSMYSFARCPTPV